MKRILRFTASWCGPCKSLAMNLETASLSLPIEVIDIDVHPEVAQEYGIRSVPTLVLMDENLETKRLIGSKTVNQLQEWAND
jgi:thioredoxin-like negative regulator of GroEL